MNPIYYGDQESKNFYEGIEKLTDRELQEKQTRLLTQIEKSNTRIKLNLQFWFYFTLIGGALTLFVLNLKK
ncbi:hypothetical protein [Flavobacterium granuli]|uniref:Haemolysin XhlA n=1 Tax=Flavobacterium granuli TaxID=280093 RepID=A0ABU1S0I0_9FLAO|nr:hypothetical protein [Flavobacterium granuli]MDR6844533.1 hypothetical protein [Flavobacterium granuli]